MFRRLSVSAQPRPRLHPRPARRWLTASVAVLAAVVSGGGLASGQPAPSPPSMPAAQAAPPPAAQALAAPPPAAQPLETAPPASAPSLRLFISRNLFAEQRPGTPPVVRPEVALQPEAALTLAAQRVVSALAQRLALVSPDPEVQVALRFRRLEGERAAGAPSSSRPATADSGRPAWSLTVVVIAHPRPLDYTYLSDGQLVVDGRIEPQRTYRVGKGLETGLALADGVVSEIVIQDEGDAELRLKRDGDRLELSVVPPSFGGKPSGTSRPWYAGVPLRFLDYQVLVGGYAAALFNNDYTGFLFPGGTPDHGVVEAWLADRFGLRVAAFLLDHESFDVERLVVAQQALRGEHWSVWVEGGAAAAQHSLTPVGGPASSRSTIGWTAGLTGHVRFGSLGAMAHWADTDGPSIMQLMAGWQATRRVGLAVSWISYRSASPTGLAVSIAF